MNRVNRGLLTLLFLQFICAGTLRSQEITIRGAEPKYAGTEITFYRFAERIAYTRDELGSCIVDPKGDFMIRFHSDFTIQVFADLGKYRVYLFAEPGNEYTVKLPPRADKTTADHLNPYFRQEMVHLGIPNHQPEELNGKIQRFDAVFTPLFRKYAFEAYFQTHVQDLDSILQNVNDSFGNDPNTYFRCYAQYKSTLLKEMTSGKRKLTTPLPGDYSTAMLYYNPAFFDWFQQVYHNYFQYLNRLNPDHYPLHEIIDVKRSYPMLLDLVKGTVAFTNDTLAELIILKGLYDEYFSKEFYDVALLEILDSLIETTSLGDHVMMAEKIKQRLTRLRVGYIPPGFKLPTFSNDTLTLNALKGKYIYLNFCTPLTPVCRNHFDMLKSIQERYGEVLEMVTVSVDEENSRMKDLIQEMDLSWTFLDSRFQSQIVVAYDVRAFPTYYLIDKQGRLLLSPAPGPDNGFEQQFIEIVNKRGDLDF